MLIWRSLSPQTIATLLRWRAKAASSPGSAFRAAATARGTRHDRHTESVRPPRKSAG